jgi:flagellar biosynthetic protein FliR
MEIPQQYAAWLPTLALVIIRAGGMFLVAPVFAAPAVPVKLRVAISIAIGLAAAGRLSSPVAAPGDWVGLATAVVTEAAIGATIGFAARVLFSGIELGAFHIAQQMGVALVDAFDPFGEEGGGSVRRLFDMLALVLFLAIGGHRVLVRSLLATFDVVPVMSFRPGESLLGMVTALLGMSFVFALRVAAPVLIAVLLATVAMGFLGRTLPQLNILTTGLPTTVMLGMLMLAAGLAAMGPILEGLTGELARRLPSLHGGG